MQERLALSIEAQATLGERSRAQALARDFAALTESYLSERFGGRPSAKGQAKLRALRDSLRA